jgi:hypothetical protein
MTSPDHIRTGEVRVEPSFIWLMLHIGSALSGCVGLLWLLLTSTNGNGPIPVALVFVGVAVSSARAAWKECP